jgi:hypothetical protein
MKFIIEKPTTNAVNYFRRAGYYFQKRDGKEVAFAKKLTDQEFPRFHAFVKVIGYKFEVNIHIDQKQTSHKGTSAHSGEYDEDNKLLRDEVQRLQSMSG